MARTRPPNETMLPAAAPVEPGALALLVGLLLLPDPLVEVDSSPEAVDEGVEPVPEMMGIVALTPGTGVMGPPGTMGVAVGTTTEVKTGTPGAEPAGADATGAEAPGAEGETPGTGAPE